jgi:hypothetical protein
METHAESNEIADQREGNARGPVALLPRDNLAGEEERGEHAKTGGRRAGTG